jgi:hyperpolarization activated cyclic nucleotide-gated potassium channel 1
VLATIGFGDIAATTNLEMILACAWILIGAMFFSFFLSTMSSVITSLDLKAILISDKLSLLTVYCTDLRLSTHFQSTMSRQLQLSMRHNTLDQQQKSDLAASLSKKLRVEMGSCIYRHAAQRVSFFAQQDPIFIGNIVSMLEYRLYDSGEVIYTRGSYADEIYFMGDGRVSFVLGSLAVPFKTMISGSFFGEIEVLEETPREYTAIAVSPTETFILSRTVLCILKDDFPQVMKQLITIAKKRKEMCLHSLIQSTQIVGQLEWKSHAKLGVDKALLNVQYIAELAKLEEDAKIRTVESKPLREGLKELAFEVFTLKTTLRDTAALWRKILQYR